MADELKVTSTARLRDLIEDTEERLSELKSELQRREDERAHDAVDHLEDYINVAEQRFGPLKDLIKMIMDELRTKK